MMKYLIYVLFFQSIAFSEYYSQYGQDKFINEIFFKNRINGVFVDIGAYDGIFLSNTYFFEKELDWTGICLEPIPHVFNQLQKNRNCLCICGCATIEHDTMQPFLQISGYSEMLSGLINIFDIRHMDRIMREIKKHGGSYKIIDVPGYNLNQILEEAGINHVHFLSLDTEGGEFEILQNFDFSKCQVDVILVEDNYKMQPVLPFLASKGFAFITTFKQDLLFINEKTILH